MIYNLFDTRTIPTYGILTSLNGADIDLDVDINHEFDLTSSDLEIMAVKVNETFELFRTRVSNVVDMIEEYDKYVDLINDDFKDRYGFLKYMKLKIDINYNFYIEMILSVIINHSYWAIYSVKYPDLFKEEIEIIMKGVKKIYNFKEDVYTYMVDIVKIYDDPRTFGAIARDNNSIFDRCVFHYKKIFNFNQ